MRRWPAIIALVATVACGHSDPFASTAERRDAPFEASAPVRLSYSSLSDFEPGFSQDGEWITYVYEESGADHDRCIGIMPATGGTRRAGLCAWYLGQADSADGLESAALRRDGVLAFTMFTGGRGALTSHQMGLFLGDPDSIQGARRVLALGQRPAGGSATWSGLVDPVWLDDGDLMVLAARRFLVNVPCNRFAGAYCPWDDERTYDRDTIPLGVELARLRLSTPGASVIMTIPANEAIAWALDTDLDRAYYIVQRARPEDEDVYHESIADTLYAVSASGGSPVALFGTIGGRFTPMLRLHGVAAGGGRVFVSRSWHTAGVDGSGRYPRGAALESDVSEVLPDGSLRMLAVAPSGHWGRIRLSPDGRHLLAEAVERTTSDIYQIEVGP